MIRSRSDLNQSTIVRHLRRCGCSVVVVSQHAVGFDLVVFYRNRGWAVEVKQPGGKDDLTPHEREMQERIGDSYIVIDSAEDFLTQVEPRRVDAHTSALVGANQPGG